MMKKSQIINDPIEDADLSGRMIWNHIIRLWSQRYTFEDKDLKRLSFLELLYGTTLL